MLSTLNPLGVEFGHGGARLINGAADPTVTATPAPLGSIYQRTDGNVYRKSGAGDTAWTLIGSGSVVLPWIDVTTAPYNCVNDTALNPLVAVLDANRIGLQLAVTDAIAAGGAIIFIPPAFDIPFNKNPGGGLEHGVLVDTAVPIIFIGHGAILRMNRAAGASDFYGFEVLGAGSVRFEGITFSQRGLFNGTDQQHMIQVGDGGTTSARNVMIDGCTFQEGSGGDGIRLLGDSTFLVEEVVITRCRFVGCDRSGISVQRGTNKVTITESYFENTGDQAIDFEPTGTGGVGQFIITENIFNKTTGTAIDVTLSGNGGTAPNQRSIFANNHMTGGVIDALNLENCLIHGNTIDYNRAGAATTVIQLVRLCNNIVVADNYIRRGVTAAAGLVVKMSHSGAFPAAIAPINVEFTGNTVIQETEQDAIKFETTSEFQVCRNNVQITLPGGAAADTYVGINSDATEGPSTGGGLSGNYDGNWVKATGIRLHAGIRVSGATHTLGRISVVGNHITNALHGVRAATAFTTFTYPPLFSDNTYDTVTNEISFGVGAATWLEAGIPNGVCSGVSAGSPEAVLTAAVGSVCRRTSNGAVYYKTTGTGNTGWSLLAFPKSALHWGSASVATTTTTRYLFPGYEDSTATTIAIQWRIPFAGTLSNLRVRQGTGAGNGNAIVYTVRVNSVASALSVSMASTANDGGPDTDVVTVAAGDLVDIEVTKAAGIVTSPTEIVASLQYSPT